MTDIGIDQIILYLVTLLVCIVPLGWYMARVYAGKFCGLDLVLKPIEYLIYHVCGINPQEEMNWKRYLTTMLLFNLFGLLLIYAIQRLQFYLPFNPQAYTAVPPDLALNTAASFVTNTDWQAYTGEATLSYFTQSVALTTQNFLSAVTGMSLLIALIRSFCRHEVNDLGNFWVDSVRGILYILLPLATLLAVMLVYLGVIQNVLPPQKIALLEPLSYTQPQTNASGQVINDAKGQPKMITTIVTEQVLPMGPVASQVAIKQLGTNGGGFFNANSAHPFENPTPCANFLEMLAILLIPGAFCYTFGIMINDRRQGVAILFAMLIILVPMLLVAVLAEQKGSPAFVTMGINPTPSHDFYPAGNMEGKESRLGIVSSAIWATATTATANGSVNAMHDSLTPIGGLMPLWMMHLGEVVFGGVGSGLYSMLIFVIITVFVAGLMVGRTPEYLGKKIEPYEMKMASVAVLVMPMMVLLCTALAVVIHPGTDVIANPGSHGFSEILYAMTSMMNNNGSAFAGLNANTPFYNLLGTFVILMGRYWIAIPVLAIAGSLVKKKIVPISLGTLPTHTPLFIFLLIGVIVILGALTFFPALSLGPIVEQLQMVGSVNGH